MASELIVQTLKGPTSGANANKVIIPSGQTLDIDAWTPPAGTVLQVVEGTGGAGELSVTSTSYVGTNCKLSITPSSTSSKVLVFGSSGFNLANATDTTLFIALYKDSSALKEDITRIRNDSSGTNVAAPLSFQFLDSPNTTSSVEYEIYVKINSGGSGQFNNGTATQARLCLMEIAG